MDPLKLSPSRRNFISMDFCRYICSSRPGNSWFFMTADFLPPICLNDVHRLPLALNGKYRISITLDTLIARFMGPTWGPSGADRTQVGPMLVPRVLLSRYFLYGDGQKYCYIENFDRPIFDTGTMEDARNILQKGNKQNDQSCFTLFLLCGYKCISPKNNYKTDAD